jgi:putative nucleotidyltransferase with HDIG domain
MRSHGPRRGSLHPAAHIRWKIIAPYAALTIALAIAGTYMVTRLVGSSLDERFNNQLAESARVSADSIVRQERRHLEAVRSISFTEGVVGAAAAEDEARLEALVAPLVANGGLEMVEILDADGQRLYGAVLTDAQSLSYAPIFDDADRGGWELVAGTRAGESDATGDKFAAIVDTSVGPVLYTAGGIYDGEELAGIALVGTPLSSLVQLAGFEAQSNITLYDAAGAVLATTYELDAESPGGALAGDARTLSAAAEAPVRRSVSLNGRNYDLLYAPLEIRGERAGWYSIGLPSEFLFSAHTATRQQMVLLFGSAIAATLAAGYLIAQGMTRPLLRLAAAANAVAGGDLSTRSGVDGRDEIGALGRAFDAMTERLKTQHLATVRALTSAIDARDPYTMGHSLRVGQLAVRLGLELGVEPALLQHLEIGGYLHDIGKIGVRDAVLLKPGMLSPEEREAIERHPTIGLEILEHVALAPEVREFVGGHHEKLNGSGYPHGLHDHELSDVPRIAAVADIYDALTTDRPYRAGMSVGQALDILYREAAQGQLDPRVVDAMSAVCDEWEERRHSEPSLRGFRIEQQQAEPVLERAA